MARQGGFNGTVSPTHTPMATTPSVFGYQCVETLRQDVCKLALQPVVCGITMEHKIWVDEGVVLRQAG